MDLYGGLRAGKAGLWLIWSFALVLVGVLPVEAKVIYVNVAASGNNTGVSWADAFSGVLGVQSALGSAVSGDNIWVAKGTYKPTNGTDRNISFMMKDGVYLYGGFLGVESLLGERDWTVHSSIMSGEIGALGLEDNSYHVVNGQNKSNHLLDGFVVSDGNRSGHSGGGAYYGTLTNCTITNCAAYAGGGAYYSTLTNCTITKCSTDINGEGGGAYYSTLTNCTITNCTASTGGGAANSILTNCTITNCTASSGGGGAKNSTLTTCTITNCTAKYGGGVYDGNLTNLTITNCTITNCTASSGGGAYSATLTNCTITDCTATGNGGGAYRSTLYNCTITGNGGGTYESFLTDCTITPVIVIYVKADATGANDGTSWANAFSGELGVQSALARAGDNEPIWVAKGTYKPTSGTDRNISFKIREGVKLYGGFNGTESVLEERDWTIHHSILSGEIGALGIEDNSYHVVNGQYNSNHLLDGFVVSDGNGSGRASGGGAFHGILTNCTITNCTADAGGGASFSTLTNCSITNCTTNTGFFGDGGGASESTLTNCTITGCSAPSGGGGASESTLTNCTISNCSAFVGGGGASESTLTNCTITGCSAPSGGGAFISTLTNCTIANSTAFTDGGGASGGLLTNCTITNCTAYQTGGGASKATLTKCMITNCNNYDFNYSGGASNSRLTNCVITNSQGQLSGQIAEECDLINCTLFTDKLAVMTTLYLVDNYYSSTIVNSIIWFNYDYNGDTTIWHNYHIASGNVTNSCIKGGITGAGNTPYDPKFMREVTGVWSSNPTVNKWATNTTLYVDSSTWSTNSMIGRLLKADNNLPGMYHVIANSNSSLTVVGNAITQMGSAFTIYNLTPDIASPCIDSGNSTDFQYMDQWGNPPGVAVEPLDILGNPRYDQLQTINTGIGPNGNYYDMGAYESQSSGLHAGYDICTNKNPQTLSGEALTINDWSVISTTWTASSGNISFDNNTNLSANVTIIGEGHYALSLSANYFSGTRGTASFADNVNLCYDITQPYAEAGPVTQFSPKMGSLSATARDFLSGIDGVQWTRTAGHPSLNIISPNSLNTAFQANVDGTYALEFTATDRAGNKKTDTVNLIVDSLAPSVDAGNTINLRLAGAPNPTATDDLAGIQSYLWSTTAPQVTIISANTLTPTVSSSAEGAYPLTLTVTDKAGNSASSNTTLVWDTTPPTVSTQPTYSASSSGPLTANATDTASPIATTLWTQISGPATLALNNPTTFTATFAPTVNQANGLYTLLFTATDKAGNSANTTTTLTYDTTGPLTNAGPDRATRTAISLAGTASDLYSGVASTTWSQTAGPASATIGNSSSPTSLVQMPTDGTYTLLLTASDNLGNTSTDTVNITWDTTAPSLSAGSLGPIHLATAISGSSATDALSGINPASYVWTKVSGPGAITFSSTTSLTPTVSASADGTYVLRLTASDLAGNSASADLTFTWDTTLPLVNAGGDISASTSVKLQGSASDSLSGVASISWTKVSGPGAVTFDNAASLQPTMFAAANGTYVLRCTVTDLAGNSASSDITVLWDTNFPSVQAGADKTAKALTVLSGNASSGSNITSVAWSQRSGPGVLTFTGNTTLTPSVSASLDGVYEIRLTARSGSGVEGFDALLLTWDTTAPLVHVGSLGHISRATSATGSSVADALSGANTSSYVWSKVAGPGNIQFSNSASLASTIRADVEGSYTLQLSASDLAGNSGSNTLTFVWDSAAPLVNAGSDRYASSAVRLVGTASDAVGTVVAYQWTKVSGPGIFIFTEATSASTDFIAGSDGSYILNCQATDDAGNSASDNLVVIWDTTGASLQMPSEVMARSAVALSANVNDSQSGVTGQVWSAMSGTGNLSLTGNTSLTPLVSADRDGRYILSLTASNGAGVNSSNTLTLVWDQTAPQLSGGVDAILKAPSALTGWSFSDATSGPDLTSIAWSQASGAGTATFSQPTASNTLVSASSDGAYVLAVSAKDRAGNSATDFVNLIWDTTLPSVSAGMSFTTDSGSYLHGQASDGLSGLASIVWSKVSGPGSAIFTPASGNLTPFFEATSDGNYLLTLTVTDKAGNSASDNVVVVWDKTAFLPQVVISPVYKPASGVLTFGQTLRISGNVSPIPDTPVFVTATNPSGALVQLGSISIGADGSFVKELTPTGAGDWKVFLHSSLTSRVKAATTPDFGFKVERATAEIVLSAPPQAELGKAITLAGALKALGAPDAKVLDGLPLTLTAISSTGSVLSTNTQTFNLAGSFSAEITLNQAGPWTLGVAFVGNNNLQAAQSANSRVEVVERPGYAVVVTGEVDGKEGHAQHSKTTNEVVSRLKALSFRPEDIYYFNSSASAAPQANYSGQSFSKAKLAQVLGTDLAARMAVSPAPLFVVLVNHGSVGKFHMGALSSDEITPAELNQWLGSLEAAMNPNDLTRVVRTVVLGACHSGSFLQGLGKLGRVVIASAAGGELSHRGPKLSSDGADRHGEYFVSVLFKLLSEGKSVKEAFEDGSDELRKFTRSNATNADFADNSAQHPLLDDDGDGVGVYQNLSKHKGDGIFGARTYCGVKTNNILVEARLTQVSASVFLGAGASFPDFKAEVNDTAELENALVEVKEPGFVQNNDPNSSMQAPVESKQAIAKTLRAFNDGSRRATVIFDAAAYADSALNLNLAGHYTLHFFARDFDTQNLSEMSSRQVYRKPTLPLSSIRSFGLLAPENQTVESAGVAFQWEGDARDGVQFILRIWKDSSRNLLAYESPLLSLPFLVLEAGILSDANTYYWDVVAVNNEGNWRLSNELRSFEVNAKNALPGWLSGSILDMATGQTLSASLVKVAGIGNYNSISGGFVVQLPPGEYVVTYVASGYSSLSGNVIIDQGSNTALVVKLVAEKVNLAPTANFVAEKSNLYRGEQARLSSASSFDPNPEDQLSFTWEFGDGSANLTLTGTTVQHRYAQAGSYPVQLTIRDQAGLRDTILKTIDITFSNNPPVISGLPTSLNFLEDGAAQVLDLSGKGQDVEDALLSWTAALSSANVVRLSRVGDLLTLTPIKDAFGMVNLTLAVSDQEGATTTLAVAVLVASVNDAPVIRSSAPKETAPLSRYEYQLTAEDTESSTLTYKVESGPDGLTLSPTGLLQWTLGASEVGLFPIMLSVSDGEARAYQSFVLQSRRPAQLLLSGPSSIMAGSSGSFVAITLDGLASANILWSLSDATVASLASFGSSAVVKALKEGVVSIKAVDLANGGIEQSQTLTVLAAPVASGNANGNASSNVVSNRPPRIISTLPTFAVAGNLLQATVQAEDEAGQSLKFELLMGPETMLLNSLGELHWLPTESDVGTHRLLIQVSDGDLLAQQAGFLAVRTGLVFHPKVVLRGPSQAKLSQSLSWTAQTEASLAPAQYLWSSSNAQVLSLSGNGGFGNGTALALGESWIEVTDLANGNVQSRIPIKVVPAEAPELSVFGPQTLKLGSTGRWEFSVKNALFTPSYEVEVSHSRLLMTVLGEGWIDLLPVAVGELSLTLRDVANRTEKTLDLKIASPTTPRLEMAGAQRVMAGQSAELSVKTLNAVGTPDYSWSVSNNTLASLMASGSRARLTAIGAGLVRVRVVDGTHGVEQTAEVEIYPVQNVDTNGVPTVSLQITPSSGNAFTNYSLKATGVDPEGLPLLYRFDLNNDSVYDTPLEGSSTLQRRFSAGRHRVRVMAVDAAGASASMSVELVVSESPAEAISAAAQSIATLTTSQLASDTDNILAQMVAISANVSDNAMMGLLAQTLNQVTQVTGLDTANRETTLSLAETLAPQVAPGSNEEGKVLDAMLRLGQGAKSSDEAQRLMGTLAQMKVGNTNRGKLIDAFSALGRTPVMPGEEKSFESRGHSVTVRGSSSANTAVVGGVTVPAGLVNRDFSLAVGSYPVLRNNTVVGTTLNIDLYDLSNNEPLDTSSLAGVQVEVDLPEGVDPTRLRMAYWDLVGQKYKDMTGPDSVNLSGKKAKFTLLHLTEFALQEASAAPSPSGSTGAIIQVSGEDVLNARSQVSSQSSGGGGGCLLR